MTIGMNDTSLDRDKKDFPVTLFIHSEKSYPEKERRQDFILLYSTLLKQKDAMQGIWEWQETKTMCGLHSSLWPKGWAT